jgi:alkanesulfonate monooxygenase SsuD/methylene tetrahydromethanopterin reductase-like flavin-dependent oxidoreductase (luciferase family)
MTLRTLSALALCALLYTAYAAAVRLCDLIRARERGGTRGNEREILIGLFLFFPLSVVEARAYHRHGYVNVSRFKSQSTYTRTTEISMSLSFSPSLLSSYGSLSLSLLSRVKDLSPSSL